MTLNIKGVLPRIGTGVAVAALLATVAMVPAAAAQPAPTAAAPLVALFNPQAGDYLRRGGHFFYGVACDPNAAAGDTTGGIAKVSLYFGNRDEPEQGGPSWRPGRYITAATGTTGNSRLGLTTLAGGPCKVANSGFQLRTTSLRKGTWDLHVYALSKSGKETHIVVPGIRVDKP
jgi:hypothetical protein